MKTTKSYEDNIRFTETNNMKKIVQNIDYDQRLVPEKKVYLRLMRFIFIK